MRSRPRLTVLLTGCSQNIPPAFSSLRRQINFVYSTSKYKLNYSFGGRLFYIFGGARGTRTLDRAATERCDNLFTIAPINNSKILQHFWRFYNHLFCSKNSAMLSLKNEISIEGKFWTWGSLKIMPLRRYRMGEGKNISSWLFPFYSTLSS